MFRCPRTGCRNQCCQHSPPPPFTMLFIFYHKVTTLLVYSVVKCTQAYWVSSVGDSRPLYCRRVMTCIVYCVVGCARWRLSLIVAGKEPVTASAAAEGASDPAGKVNGTSYSLPFRHTPPYPDHPPHLLVLVTVYYSSSSSLILLPLMMMSELARSRIITVLQRSNVTQCSILTFLLIRQYFFVLATASNCISTPFIYLVLYESALLIRSISPPPSSLAHEDRQRMRIKKEHLEKELGANAHFKCLVTMSYLYPPEILKIDSEDSSSSLI